MTTTIVRTATLVLAAGLTLSAQGKTFSHEIKTSPGQILELRLEVGGQVTIFGSDAASVQVEATFAGPDAGDVIVSARQTGGGVEVASNWTTEPRQRAMASGRFTIRVPRRFHLHIGSMVGNLTVDNVEGQVWGETRGGNLSLKRLSGKLQMTTRGGNISVSDSRLDGMVSTAGGDITLEDVVGHLETNSMGGDVVSRSTGRRVEGTTAPAPREMRVKTTGGVDLAEAMAGATVTNVGGNIHIQRAADHVQVTTTGGDVRLDSVDGWIEVTAVGGDIVATMVGDPARGDRHVRLVSTKGDITLTVPASLDMRFDIALSYTRNSRQNYEIRSDFPVQIRRTTEWDYAKGDPRRYVYGTGTAGKGRHLVHIETVNGDVIIRKAR
jgi:DUF4097 and DUF4098 domain-containing protein YvlB